jgi:hypothetical protein
MPAGDFYRSYLYDLYTFDVVLELVLADALISEDRAPALADTRSPGLSLFLLKDRTFYLEYKEGRRGGYDGGTVLFSTMLTGSWTLTQGRIELEDTAVIAANENADEGVQVTFQADVMSPGLMGDAIDLDTRSFAGSSNPLDPLLRKHGFKPPLPPDLE